MFQSSGGKRRVVRGGVVMLGLIAGLIVLPGLFPYRWNLSASVPVGLYRFSHGAIEPGSVVSFCLPEAVARYAKARGYIGFGFPCPGWTQPLLKPVVAVAGDAIQITREGVTVRGLPVAHTPVFTHDSQRRLHTLRLPEGESVVPPGSVFVLSALHERSWDSRYFGPIPLTSITGVMEPVWAR